LLEFRDDGPFSIWELIVSKMKGPVKDSPFAGFLTNLSLSDIDRILMWDPRRNITIFSDPGRMEGAFI
jgi:hypothetical protein